MKYGKETITIPLDDNGSKVTEERNIMDFKTTNPIRKRYEYRIKVKDKKEELTEYLKFSDSLDNDKKDPAFNIEKTKHGDTHGYYYVVKAWTILEYTN